MAPCVVTMDISGACLDLQVVSKGSSETSINFCHITRRHIQKPALLEDTVKCHLTYYRSADKSPAQPGRKQATATEDYDLHISHLLSKLEEYYYYLYIYIYI